MVSEMNHVQAIKNQFERLSVCDAPPPASELKTFRRSATLVEISPQANQFQRQDSGSKSVRRRDAFRLEKKPAVMKSPPPPPPNPQCDSESEELQYLATSETIKKALRQPLPSGSPPKKPPRTFAATPLSSPVSTEAKEFPASPQKPSKLKLFNCLISPCSIDPVYYEQIKAERRMTSEDDDEEEEEIYSEPTLRTLDVVTKPQPEELHYMCTNIIDQTFETNETSSLENHDSASFSKLNILMDVMYDEGKRDRMLEDDSSSSSSEVRLPKAKVTRSLTEKRKNYVRRTTESITSNDLIECAGSAASVIKQFQRIIDQHDGGERKKGEKDETKLFKMALLVGYDVMNKKGYVKSIYPSGESPLPMLEQFVYPTDKDPCDLMTRDNQNFMMILTDINGDHLFGYCRQIIPEGFEKCLPLTYCIIAPKNASGFFFSLLGEIESRHGIASQQFNSMMRSLHAQPFPSPSHTFKAKFSKPPPPPDLPKRPDPDLVQRSSQKFAKRLSLESPEWLRTEAQKSFSPVSRSDEISIRREADVRLESGELSVLYESLTRELLVAIFGTLLIERKVILVGRSVSQLSKCVMAFYALLYPFRWPHPIITVVPEQINELLQAPFPFFAGVLRSTVDVNALEIEDGIVVDLDSKTLIRKCGDEGTLLPDTLRKSLLLSLRVVEAIDKGKKLVNVLIAEAFLQFFVKLFAGLDASTYSKEKFIETQKDEGTKFFLEWFLDTILFREFVEMRKRGETAATFELFDLKILGKSATLTSSHQKKHVEALLKTSKHKKRNFKDRIKDFLSH